MQDYLLPNDQKMTKEEAQNIFKMRTKMINLKANYKGKNNTILCSSCNDSNESQEHIYNDCKEIMKETNNQEIPDYNLIMTGNIKEKLKVMRIFTQKMKIHEKLSKTEIT